MSDGLFLTFCPNSVLCFCLCLQLKWDEPKHQLRILFDYYKIHLKKAKLETHKITRDICVKEKATEEDKATCRHKRYAATHMSFHINFILGSRVCFLAFFPLSLCICCHPLSKFLFRFCCVYLFLIPSIVIFTACDCLRFHMDFFSARAMLSCDTSETFCDKTNNLLYIIRYIK